MTLHIFNPDHDIALATNLTQFTPPHAGRQLRSDLGFLPALWAKKGDVVIVEDIESAMLAYQKLRLANRTEVEFVTLKDVADLINGRRIIDIQPWGWNISLRDTLHRAGIPTTFMPDNVRLDAIRDLSNRRLAVKMLDMFKEEDGLTGFSRNCDTYDELMFFIQHNRDVVLKAPWSSSGRGVRYLNIDEEAQSADANYNNTLNWIRNVIERQGSIIAEVKCHKIQDFAVEFNAKSDGSVSYSGLSVFSTNGSAYTGNMLCSDSDKEEMIARYISPELLSGVIGRIERFLSEHISRQYVGPLGVDMMICSQDGRFLLNPCIEINMRRTMGHVALALSRSGQRGTMTIEYDGSYKLKLKD